MTKEELRKIYLEKRRRLSDSEYEKLSSQLCDYFFKHIDLSTVKVLHIFIPIEKNKEPNTWFIIDRIQKEFSEINLAVPRVNNPTGYLENFIFSGKNQLQENKWSILEPQYGKVIQSVEIDMVLIPLLVFDEQGHRIGYGKGIYDKFLASCRSDCKKIGVSFFPPQEQKFEVQSHDISLDYCLTPIRIYRF